MTSGQNARKELTVKDHTIGMSAFFAIIVTFLFAPWHNPVVTSFLMILFVFPMTGIVGSWLGKVLADWTLAAEGRKNGR